MYTVQMVSTTHCSLKAASLKMALTVERGGSIFQGQERSFELLIAWVQLTSHLEVIYFC